MESLKSAINAMRKDYFMASVDLADAFYSITIREQDRRYFRFYFNDIKYQFTALVMGYSSSPRIFTKILKPVFAYLRSLGHVSVYFIDDSWLVGDSYQSCMRNVNETVHLMDKLGLTVNQKKSVLEPCKKLIFLGFILCSESMTVKLTFEKGEDIINLCSKVLNTKRITIRVFAKLIGKLTAAEPGVKHAPLYIRPLEKIKENELKLHKGNFDNFMNVPQSIHTTLLWWIENIQISFKNILSQDPNTVIYTDASLKMFGAFNETNGQKTNGFWSHEEQKLHINILEMKACEIGLRTFCKSSKNILVKLYTDNTTCCSYINRYGGKVRALDDIARRIWFWCVERNIMLTAAHIAGVSNTHADKLSRTGNDDIEWSLEQGIFDKILKHHQNI
ncbi:uncharacterized protein LOC132722634 [Ruditapes philippinarum]|uniref:uncharacterized protein LOC132722634 n=1 Tax=Ruditapes philippinarum TaxID=129788 RepID=UPI00295AF6C3|nr:uncharacterized protein LOC132722634 [Ruditapes philippinarum]